METTASKEPHHPLWKRVLGLLLSLMAPVLVLAAAEGGLRLLGVGYATNFWLEAPAPNSQRSNPRFGWRFFPRSLARAPVPSVVGKEPVEGTFRVAVVGGSAALGTPEPAFSFGRMLEALVELRHPGQGIELLPTAMTAINSHVASTILEDTLALEPDMVIVYLGNNEVVGPYGAASVLGQPAADRRLLRLGIELRQLRLAQFTEGLLTRGAPAPRWQGMKMFLGQQIAATDPRLEGVYSHFEANLVDMSRAAQRAGVPLVLSTVAVNLRDQAPFASLERKDLPFRDRWDFDKGLESAWERLEAGDASSALATVDGLMAQRGDHAEAHFLRGRALLALDRSEDAVENLERARDLDLLRFRADRRINEVIRSVAAAEQITLVDLAEHFRTGAGGEPLPGRRLFHEHVHLNFAGNYAAALYLLPMVEAKLPGSLDAPPPSLAEVAEHLAFTPFDAAAMERDMLALVSRSPFMELVGQRRDLALRRVALRQLEAGLDDAAWQRAEAIYRRRLERRPGDLLSRRRFAELLSGQERGEEAAALWGDLLAEYPNVLGWYDAQARALASADQEEEALALLEEAIQRFPESRADLWINEGTLHEAAGRRESARVAFRKAREEAPERPEPLYNLALLEIRSGQDDLGFELLQQLVEEHPSFAPGHHNLGVAHERRGEMEEALGAFRWEIALTPENPEGYTALARTLRSMGDAQRAVGELASALERDPGYAPALFELADLLYHGGRKPEAATLYRRGLTVEPGNAEARRRLRELIGSP